MTEDIKNSLTKEEEKERISEIFADLPLADLYKKYRPKLWKDVIGQDPIVDSLKRAVLNKDIAGAYGFFGPAGCGKTTVGLIYAKALNCENLQADAEPCLKCETCLSIENETSFGFNYFSMANDGSVDKVRSIIERAQMKQPVNRQVWILDETHNLHEKAYDALLIPTEKKQDRAVFIFCSTDQHKIKDTVLQRIQTKNFVKVPADIMRPYCLNILRKVGLSKDTYTSNKDLIDKVINAAIELGNGHVRKTLSYLEEILSTGSIPSLERSKLMEGISKLSVFETISELSRLIDTEALDVLDISREIHESLTEDLKNLRDKKVKERVIASFGNLDNFVEFIGKHGEAVDKACYSLEQRTVYEAYLSLALLHVKRNIPARKR